MKKILVGFAFAMILASNLAAQGIYATLTGIVADQSSAVVPQAKVTLKDSQSGSLRDTVTNNDGYFTFASVPVGEYELAIEAKGFSTFKVTGITLSGGEKRNIDAKLTVGTTSEAVEVTGEVDKVAPVDSAEKSNLVTAKELQNFIQVGSNAVEFIKIMPGFGIQNGTSNSANYDGTKIGINGNGDGGSQSPLNNAYSYNGLPGNSMDITADGAHVSDPGCNCDTPVNPNSDMISEIQVKMSNFDASTQKGPAVITSVAKSGGRDFHGSGFFYARNYAMNANDALNNAVGQKRPEDKYYYPGGTLGGPVVIPGTHFNHDRNKLFFFTGFEYFYQVLDTALLRATVPADCERAGNFTASCVAQEGAITQSGGPPGQLNAAGLAKFPTMNLADVPGAVDTNMQALMKLYPEPNANPSQTGGYNYQDEPIFNQNNTQWMTRLDYSVSDNTKLFVRYNLQRETQEFPVGLWWRNGNQVPYPTPILGKNKSDSVTASLTHVFNPTMTNEFVFAYTFVGFPNVFQDPSKVDRNKIGYTYKGLFSNTVAQIPSFGGGPESGLVFNPGGFEVGGNSQGLYADKYMPSWSDTLTKVWATHTVKAGLFWEWIRNAQPASNNSNGSYAWNIDTWQGNTFGNDYADMIYGNLGGYGQQNFNRVNDESYQTAEFFAQDSWKATRRLTFELGLRLTHFQPWADREGFGFAVFIPKDYNANCTPIQYCGFQWHAKDSAIPIGGFPTTALLYQPRIGVAFDLSGEGKTVLRGGWGRYYYHSGQFTNGLDVTAGSEGISLPNNINGVPLLARNLSSINVAAQAASPSALDPNNNKTAYTDNWNFTVSQRTPWSGLLEAAYVGNRSRDGLSNNNNGAGANVNLVPVGAMLSSKNGGVDPNTALNANNFRPMPLYSDLGPAVNILYANYNALQVTWVRTKGRYTINMNYTYGKSMGILNNGAYDQFNLANNYGVQPTNRKDIINAAYSIELGTPIKHNILAQGLINGWQLSGITQIQSGANVTGFSTNANFNMNLNSYKIPGTTFNVSNASLLGTTDIQLNPILTCNPTSNLTTHQYINPSCFSFPKAIGQNGGTILPAIYGPAFFNSDLGMFKNFNISESKKLQLRFNAYNFLNHPLWSFNGNNLNLGFDGTTGAVNTPTFGTVVNKQGHRTVQAAIKFYF